MSQNTTAMQCGAGGETTGATDMTTQQPDALRLANVCSNLTRYSMDAHLIAAELCRQQARITELESQLAQRFDAADMATAAAQGFRDGVASLSANAGEPRNAIERDALIDAIAQGLHGTWHCTRVWEAWHVGTMSQDDFEPVDESETPTEIADAVLALLAAPPAAQAEGWKPIETAPKDGQAILVTDGMDCYCVEWDEEFDWWTVDDNKLGPFRLRGSAPTHWMPLPPVPGPADGESNGWTAAQAISAEPAGATEMEKNLQRTAVGWQERALRAERNWVVCRRWAIAGGAPVEKLGDDPDQPFHAASPAIEGESNV